MRPVARQPAREKFRSQSSSERFRGWSPVETRYSLNRICGPVAQRLEQGTHNSLHALGSLLHVRDSHDSQRPQTTIRHAENGNKWQQSLSLSATEKRIPFATLRGD